jgi:GT2 family glycosyltransferase
MTGALAVDVIIVNFNTRTELAACLRSLHDAPPARPHQIVVVDNGSTDGSQAMVREAWPAIRLEALGHNAGFGAANNHGIRVTQAPLVLLLNSDTVVPAGALDALCARLSATGAVAAGPKLIGADGRPEVSCGAMLTPWAELLQAARVTLARSRAGLAERYVRHLTARERFVDWVSGACLLVRRADLEAAGLFDERYFLYEEDVDLCAALRARGGRVLFTPRVEVVHLRGRSRASTAGRPSAYDRSHLAFYAKHRPRWLPWLRLWQRLRGRE